MSAALENIRAKIGAETLCESCSRDGCRVFLDGVPHDRIVADADKAFDAHGQPGKRCDFVLFAAGTDGNLVAAPIELKSGRVDVSDALKQLQAGAGFAGRFAAGAGCRPVLIHGKPLHRKERRELDRGKIRFGGVALTVKTARCGRPGNLAGALDL